MHAFIASAMFGGKSSGKSAEGPGCGGIFISTSRNRLLVVVLNKSRMETYHNLQQEHPELIPLVEEVEEGAQHGAEGML